MASIFGKDPSKQPAPDSYARERIEQEIGHLKKPQSTRHAREQRQTLGIFVTFVVAMAVAGLYFMDPCFYAWYKTDAIKDYLYLHNYDTGAKAQAIAATGILTGEDVAILNLRHGSFQDYYPSSEDAYKEADSIIGFMNNLSKVRTGPYDDLDLVGKIRYNLFCRWGILPPKQWTTLNPVISDQ